MAKLSSVKQSLTKQNEGVWVEWEGLFFKIARIGNDQAKKLKAAEAARNRERRERKEPERPWDEFWIEMLCTAVLLDWDKVERDDGTPWKYSVAEAIVVLSKPEYSDLKRFIENAAATREYFLEGADSEAEKNSSALLKQTLASAEKSAPPSTDGSQESTARPSESAQNESSFR